MRVKYYHIHNSDEYLGLMGYLGTNGYHLNGGCELVPEIDLLKHFERNGKELEIVYADREKKTVMFSSLEYLRSCWNPPLIEVSVRDHKLFLSGVEVDWRNSTRSDSMVRPDYYKNGGHDLFDHFTEIMPTQGFRGFMIGNIFKYVTRYPAKNGLEDLHKAQTYLNRLIEFEEAKNNENC